MCYKRRNTTGRDPVTHTADRKLAESGSNEGGKVGPARSTSSLSPLPTLTAKRVDTDSSLVRRGGRGPADMLTTTSVVRQR